MEKIDSLLIFLSVISIGLIVAYLNTYKELEGIIAAITTTISVAGFLLAVVEYFRRK